MPSCSPLRVGRLFCNCKLISPERIGLIYLTDYLVKYIILNVPLFCNYKLKTAPNGKKFNKKGEEIITYKYLGYFERTAKGKQDAQILLAQYNAGVSIDLPKNMSTCPTFKELADI